MTEHPMTGHDLLDTPSRVLARLAREYQAALTCAPDQEMGPGMARQVNHWDARLREMLRRHFPEIDLSLQAHGHEDLRALYHDMPLGQPEDPASDQGRTETVTAEAAAVQERYRQFARALLRTVRTGDFGSDLARTCWTAAGPGALRNAERLERVCERLTLTTTGQVRRARGLLLSAREQLGRAERREMDLLETLHGLPSVLISRLEEEGLLAPERPQASAGVREIVALIGAPGSGKGTLAGMLRSDGYHHVSTGDLLRDLRASDPNLDGLLAGGHLVPDEEVVALLPVAFGDHQRLLLDGCPRTEAQVQLLADLFPQAQIRALGLRVDEETVLARVAHRRAETIARGDAPRPEDDPEVAKRRLNIFREQTEPVSQAYARRNTWQSIDASGSPQDVLALARAALGLNP